MSDDKESRLVRADGHFQQALEDLTAAVSLLGFSQGKMAAQMAHGAVANARAIVRMHNDPTLQPRPTTPPDDLTFEE